MKIKPGLAVLAAAFPIFSWLAPAAFASVPPTISYQATLRKSGALFTGTAAMEFRITNADGSTVYWTSGSTNVVVSAGLFRYQLGTPNEAQFAAVPWADISPYVLMKVDGSWLPAEPFNSSAYSLHAYRAEGSSGTFTAFEGDIRISTTSGSKGLVFQDGSAQYTASGWTLSGSNAYTTFAGNAGIGVTNPLARLDVQGGPSAQYAQIWRNEAGVIKASMTTSGMLYADGSLMRNMPTGADNLGNHTANRDLDISGYNVVNVSTISGYGQALRVGSEMWLLDSRFGIGTYAPAAQLHISTSAGSSGDMLVLSTGIVKVIRMNGAGAIYATKYYGDGSALTGVSGSGGSWNQTLTQNLVTGPYWISSDGSSSGLNLDAGGNVGIGQAAGSARLDVRGAVGNYVQLWRNSSGVVQASMTVLGALYADGSQLRNLPAGGTATRALDMASFGINNVSTMTAGYLSSQGAGVVFTTNALVVGGRLGIDTQAPQEKLDVRGNILSSPLADGSSNRCVYADANGVLRAKGSDCGLASPTGDNLGDYKMLQNLNTNGNWISGDNSSAGLTVSNTGDVGIGMSGAATRLDVRAGSGGYAQFWRDPGGTIIASMTATGLLYADASKLRNLPVGADNFGNHTATQAVNMAGFQILDASSVTVTGASGVGAARLSLAQNVEISSTTAARYGGIYVSTNVYLAAGGKYYGDGSQLTGVISSPDNLGDHTATQNLDLASFNINNVSTMTAGYLASQGAGVVFTTNALVMGGRLGIDTLDPQEKLHVEGNILSSTLAGASNRCVYVDANGVLRAKGSDCGTAAGAADDLGSHVMTQNLNTNGNWISGDNSSAGLTVANTGNVGVGLSGAATRLDVQAGSGGYAQFWRDAGGVIVASMTSAGKLFADGTGLRNAGSDNLGNHTATQNLDLASHDITNVSTITAGYLTSTGPGVVFSTNIIVAEGNVGINTYAPQERLHVNGNILSSNLAGASNRCVYVDVNGVFHAKGSDCGLASPTGDNLGDHVMTQNLVTGTGWLSGDGDNEGIRIDSLGNVSIGDPSAGARLDVRGAVGNYIQAWRNVAGVTQASMSVTGVLYADGSGLRNLPSTADNLGNHTLTQNLITNFNWISADGASTGLFVDINGNVGVGRTPVTRLDVKPVGGDIYSQIWRNSGDTIVASMTAAGVLYADASKLRNIPSSADSLGSHIATTTLQMSGFGISNAGAITANGQVTSYSSVTVAGAAGLGAAKVRLASGVEISSAPASQQGGVYVSSNVYLAGGARYYGDGSGLTALSASNVSAGTLPDARLSANVPRLDADQQFDGVNTFSSSLTVTSVSGLASPRLRLNSNVSISSAADVNYGGVYVSTNVYLPAGAKYYGDGSGLSALNASAAVSGTLPDAQLSANVPLLAANQQFAGVNTFTSSLTVTSASGAFSSRLMLAQRVEISSAPAARYGGVQVSTNVYLPAGAKYYGDGSGLTALNASAAASGTLPDAQLSANVPLLAANQQFAGVNTFTSSLTVTSASGAFSSRLMLARNVELSSAAAALYGGVQVSTNVYLPAGARYYGDGTPLTGVTDAAALRRAGDTMTGQLTLSGSTLTVRGNSFSVTGSDFMVTPAGYVGIGTLSPGARLEINDADSNADTSGVKFTNFACSGSDKLTVNSGGDLLCATDVSGGGGSNLNAVLTSGNDAGGLSIVNSGDITANGHLTVYSSATVAGALGLGAARLGLAPNVEISSAAAANYGGVYISTNVYLPAGAKYYGDGSGLVNVLTNPASQDVDLAGHNLLNASVISGAAGAAVNFSTTVMIGGNVAVGGGGAFGNGPVGIGTYSPLASLHISSAAGYAGNMVIVSTGTSPVITMTGAGEVYALKFYGNGSGLTGVSGSDNLGNHTATQNLNMASYNITSVSTITVGYLSSGGAGVVFTTNALVMGGSLGVDTLSPQEKLQVQGNILSSGLSGTGNRCVYADNFGVLRAESSDCGLASPTGDNLGSHVMTQNLVTGSHWISYDGSAGGLSVNISSNVGIGVLSAATRLDIKAAPGDSYAQIWRNSGGTIVASMTATGTLYATGLGSGGGGGGGTPESCANPNDPNDILVPVGDFCVDKYEASIYSSVTGGTKYGVGADDYPCNDSGQDCSAPGTQIFARSVAEVPSSSMTWFQANAACANSGKHLITNAEWQAAVTGTTDPGATGTAPNCNVSGAGPSTGGTGSSCLSSFSVENMVGSLWEWVSDWGMYNPNTGTGDWTSLGSSYNGDLAGGAATYVPIAAMARGGSYNSGTNAGVYAFKSYLPNVSRDNLGFRCGMRLR